MMRGKTTCPQCGENYILDVPDTSTGKYSTTCPKCGHAFQIDVGGKYSWEDNDEKTPLIPPSLHFKPRTAKPKIAGVLLVITCLLGVLIWGSLYVNHEDIIKEASTSTPWKASLFQGSVVDETGVELGNVQVLLQTHNVSTSTDSTGHFSMKDIPWGYQTLILSKENYTPTHVHVFIFPFHMEGLDQEYLLTRGTGETPYEYDDQLKTDIDTLIPRVSLVFIVFSLVALAGGICSFQRKFFPVALLGSLCGLFTIGPLFFGSILSLVALVLIIISRYEFGGKPNEIIY